MALIAQLRQQEQNAPRPYDLEDLLHGVNLKAG